VNTWLVKILHPADVVVSIDCVEAAEVDEMWSFVEKRKEQRWLWHAIDHCSGKVLAYVFGRRKDDVFLRLKALLKPFGITRSHTDNWGVYARNLDPNVHSPGKRNTQQIERKHLTLRTRIKRLARRTICFSKSIEMHDIVIGLFVNRVSSAYRFEVSKYRSETPPSTASGSPRNWSRTSSGTLPTAPSSTRRPIASVTPLSGSGTRSRGSSRPYCEGRFQ
jgi:insertion element IS1 protein InsB